MPTAHSSRGESTDRPVLAFERLGRIGYQQAYDLQQRHVEMVQGWRTDQSASDHAGAQRPAGIVMMLEHDSVITVSNRPTAQSNLLASEAQLAAAGIALAATDRGGDITYHGPGQLVAYPIVDLNRLHLRLHEYMRLLEDAVIEVCAHFGIAASRDAVATGVWVGQGGAVGESGELPARKICAMGIRVRQWVAMHGLALNVSTDLSHFGMIVPCGLAGRPVTSMLRELQPAACPTMTEVMDQLTIELAGALGCTVAGA